MNRNKTKKRFNDFTEKDRLLEGGEGEGEGAQADPEVNEDA